LNIVAGTMHEGNVVVLSPLVGPFASKFAQYGTSVRTGDLQTLLNAVRDVFCIICNTIMTAPIVIEMSRRPHPVIWILHEWWDDGMIIENLAMRNLGGMTLSTVKGAMAKASRVVCVCEGQKKLYNPSGPSSVIYVGVPAPSQDHCMERLGRNRTVTTFLCLGIVCPRKNQVWAVKLFKELTKSVKDCKLLIVGARYTRSYEIEYVEALKTAIAGDPRIELHDVSDDVDMFYDKADILLFTSVNEVTPMVITEAMSHGIPCIATNIAGIPEMIRHGYEGFLVDPGDDAVAVDCMHQLATNSDLRYKMGTAGKARFAELFDLNIMVDRYRQLIFEVAPPVVLVDMDGTIVDWDAGFRAAWSDRSIIDRSQSYYMERCVGAEHHREAELLYHNHGFFESLPEVPGAVAALREMQEQGLRVLLCTTPVLTSLYCAQEKLNWVRTHLGECWLDKVILCSDKTAVRGDILVDDKPLDSLAPQGRHTTATWRQVVYDAPYNCEVAIPRLRSWSDWKSVILPLLGKPVGEYGEPCPSPKSHIDDASTSRQENGISGAENVEMLLGAFRDSLEPGDELSLTLTDDSDSFLEDYLGVKSQAERAVKERGLDGLKVSLSQRVVAKRRDEEVAALAVGAEDVMEVELFRRSYRRWRLDNTHFAPR